MAGRPVPGGRWTDKAEAGAHSPRLQCRVCASSQRFDSVLVRGALEDGATQAFGPHCPWPTSSSKTDFERHVERVVDEVGRRIRLPVHGLNGANGTYAVSPAVDWVAFGAFVALRDLLSEFPGLRGLGFLQRVEYSDLRAFEAGERADGTPAFNVQAMHGGTSGAGRHERWIIKQKGQKGRPPTPRPCRRWMSAPTRSAARRSSAALPQASLR